MSEPARPPPLVLVRGDASAEEIAALIAVLAARRAAATQPFPAGPVSRWGSAAARLRRPLSHGPGAWRASARPG